MPDLDTATDFQRALAIGRNVARNHVADVGHQVGFGQVAPPVNPGGVELGLVRARHEIAHRGHGAIGNDANLRPVDSDWPEKAGRATEIGANFFFCRKTKLGEAGQLARFYFVQAVVAAQQQNMQPAVGNQRQQFYRAL